MDFSRISQKTIDVRLFFGEVTQGYSDFTDSINHFSQNLASYSPQQISLECNKIQKKRDNLSILDQKLLTIVKFARAEIQHEAFVNDYRIAFYEAISACDNLYAHLQQTKAELLSAQFTSAPH